MTTPTYAAGARWTERPLFSGGVLLAGAILASGVVGWTQRDEVLGASEAAYSHVASARVTKGDLSSQLDDVKGQMAIATLQLERSDRIVAFSTKYQIPADLAASIYDIALSEGIEPSLAFRLIKVESNFMRTAKSGANALGYTQVQLPTARYYEPGVDEQKLLERDTNLRIGFRFLKDLLHQFNNDVPLALVAYNRGPSRVAEILEAGGDPTNGYADWVLTGHRPGATGVVE
jgi:soluble lytic murein transglycosylase-like protein